MGRGLAAYVAAAFASAAIGAPLVWGELAEEARRYAGFEPEHVEQLAPPGLSPTLTAFWRSQLRPGDRFYLQLGDRDHPDPPRPVDAAYWAAYSLLPALRVLDPGDATVVLSYHGLPDDHGRPYAELVHSPDGLGAAARFR